MSATLSWLLLAAAVLLLPPRQARGGGVHRPKQAVATRAMSTPMLQVVVVGAVLLACCGLFGLAAGGLLAAALCPAAGFLTARSQNRPARASPDSSLALVLDLIAAGLRGGQPLAAAVLVAAPAASAAIDAELRRVGGLLRLGADPDEAWRVVAADGALAPVAAAARRSASSGIRLARGLEHLAADTRLALRSAAQARAHRAGVFAMAPLGLCFLPAFICLGVAPVVAGVVSEALGGLP
ncbi:MAG: type II secretion system F family protein [Jatrophihabitantaceae bacterium]